MGQIYLFKNYLYLIESRTKKEFLRNIYTKKYKYEHIMYMIP